MMQPYSEGTFDDVAKYKFEQAEDDLEAAKLLLEAGKYKAANNTVRDWKPLKTGCFQSL